MSLSRQHGSFANVDQQEATTSQGKESMGNKVEDSSGLKPSDTKLPPKKGNRSNFISLHLIGCCSYKYLLTFF